MEFGLLHPGEMGATFGEALTAAGHRVRWLPEGRSDETAERASRAGLTPASSLAELVRDSETILSICPPHAAVDVARAVMSTPEPFRGTYIDANAISPATAGVVASIVRGAGARCVDGSIIGRPRRDERMTLYVSGPDAAAADVVRDAGIAVVALDGDDTAASALKMTFAAWSKGTSALILAISAMASRYGVDGALLDAWDRSEPQLIARRDAAVRAALAKGWRWAGEMEEIGTAFSGADLPDGFGRAAAEVYRRVRRREPGRPEDDLRRVVDDLGAR